jgi:pimeloyl-ACP methyl ester carboxylesterase
VEEIVPKDGPDVRVLAVARGRLDRRCWWGTPPPGSSPWSALVAAPDAFAGAVLYEPAATIADAPWDEPLARCLNALDQGRPGEAIRVFAADIVKVPAWQTRLGGLLVGLIPKYRGTVAGQIHDAKAIHDLGVRLDAYRGIRTPVLLLSGGRSPGHLADRLDALVASIPQAEKLVLEGQGHAANRRAPARARPDHRHLRDPTCSASARTVRPQRLVALCRGLRFQGL